MEAALPVPPDKLEPPPEKLPSINTSITSIPKQSSSRKFVLHDESEVVTLEETKDTSSPKQFHSRTFVVHAGSAVVTLFKEIKDTFVSPGKVEKRVEYPKDPPSWIKHKIYNMRSKVLVKREEVSS